MAVDIKKMEVDRIENLIRGFGWEVAETRFTNGEVVVIIKKKLAPEAVAPGTPG